MSLPDQSMGRGRGSLARHVDVAHAHADNVLQLACADVKDLLLMSEGVPDKRQMR